jgi:hypothetical protein
LSGFLNLTLDGMLFRFKHQIIIDHHNHENLRSFSPKKSGHQLYQKRTSHSTNQFITICFSTQSAFGGIFDQTGIEQFKVECNKPKRHFQLSIFNFQFQKP